VGEHTPEPTLVDVGHAAPFGFLADGLLRLLFGPYQQQGAVVLRQLFDVLVGLFDLSYGFLEINDVNAIALRKDIRSHFWIPAAGLMSEVHSRLQELLHGNDGHQSAPSLLVSPPPASSPSSHRGDARSSRPGVAWAPASRSAKRVFLHQRKVYHRAVPSGKSRINCTSPRPSPRRFAISATSYPSAANRFTVARFSSERRLLAASVRRARDVSAASTPSCAAFRSIARMISFRFVSNS